MVIFFAVLLFYFDVSHANFRNELKNCVSLFFASPKLDDRFGAQSLTFSFESEFDLRRSPGVLNYYRLAAFEDHDWLQPPLEERVELALKELDHRKASKTDPVFVAIAGTPDFLSKKLILDSSGQVEISDNQITDSIEETAMTLDWVWSHIGAGSLHGHVALKRFEYPLEGAENYLKFDSEISLLELLSKNYESRLQRSTVVPGRILGYAFLGPIDKQVYTTFRAQFRKFPLKKGFKNPRTKFFFGVTYRPDLYGPSRVGFEIRNCLGNKDCIEKKMRNLARQIPKGFVDFRTVGPGPLLSKANYWRLMLRHPTLWPLIYGHSIHLRNENSWLIPAGAKYAHRMTLPFLEWEQHPLVLNLPLADQAEFHSLNSTALAELTSELKVLSKSREKNQTQKLEETVTAISKWASASHLGAYLRKGMQILDPEYQ